jgi:hypothetical protein
MSSIDEVEDTNFVELHSYHSALVIESTLRLEGHVGRMFEKDTQYRKFNCKILPEETIRRLTWKEEKSRVGLQENVIFFNECCASYSGPIREHSDIL